MHTCDVVAAQGLHALVGHLGQALIALEAHQAELRLGQPRGDLRDLDAVREEVLAHGLGEGVHGVLAGAVHVAARVHLLAGDAADVHDVAPATRHHAGDHRAAHVQQTLHVGVQHGVPVVEVSLLDRRHACGQPGVVHQQVDVLPVVGQAVDGALHFVVVAHVHAQGMHHGATLDGAVQALELALQHFEPVAAATGDDDAPAFAGEAAGGGLAEAGGGAGDEGRQGEACLARVFGSAHENRLGGALKEGVCNSWGEAGVAEWLCKERGEAGLVEWLCKERGEVGLA